MLNISAILEQATDILSGRSDTEIAETFGATDMLDGLGVDPAILGNLPTEGMGETLSELGLEDALPFDPSILSAASDVLEGRG